ncbi:hypothetical protein GCM10008935_17440 [Alkalibacillus silvisoli]|uniref:GNAT family N-acetyltransferase n=1 Tax=Alkalibacillus silvisoli TaxID=392823 RepID=A0ABN0ZY53_9BACI
MEIRIINQDELGKISHFIAELNHHEVTYWLLWKRTRRNCRLYEK